MYINPVNSPLKSNINLLLEKTIDLSKRFKSYEHNDNVGPSDSDAEGRELCDDLKSISDELSSFVHTNNRELKDKIYCLALLNNMEALTAEDRIAQADNTYDRVAWSIIRDLSTTHLSPA